MAEALKPFLYTRSDGYTETRGGEFAIVMRVRTGCKSDLCWFQYRPSFNAEPIRVEWAPTDNILLLPKDVVVGLLRARYARLPTQAEIDTFLAGPLPQQIIASAELQKAGADAAPVTPQAATQAAETPAPVVAPAAAPENAPTGLETAAAAQEPAAPAPLPVADVHVQATPPAHVHNNEPGNAPIEEAAVPAADVPAPAPEPEAATVKAPADAPKPPPVAAPSSVVKAPPKKTK